MKAIIRYVMCKVLNQHYYEPTSLERWEVMGENWVCKRCGKAVKSIRDMIGTKGKITL